MHRMPFRAGRKAIADSRISTHTPIVGWAFIVSSLVFFGSFDLRYLCNLRTNYRAC